MLFVHYAITSTNFRLLHPFKLLKQDFSAMI